MSVVNSSRRSLRLALVALLLVAQSLGSQAAEPKVLRYAFPIAETGFDPAQIVDVYSRIVTAHIFEGLYTYDHLARPPVVRPLIAQDMPVHSDDFKTWTVKIRPGIYFADDPVFKGKKRELVAQDFVYAFKRPLDPANKSPTVSGMQQYNILGLNELRAEAEQGKKPFDYDREIEGLRALDRYTIQFKVKEPRPRFLDLISDSDLHGAVAREVVEAYGDKIAEHPVGTGPFKLAQWRRSSLIVLERNPDYREVLYDARPAADDAQGQALLARLKGRRLPMVDRVEVSIIEESQPRWLSFLNEQIDFINVPGEFVTLAMPNGRIAPNLAKRGIQAFRVVNADSAFTYFNMEHPVMGGYTPERVALRRAVALSMDVQREISQVRRGQAIVAQSIMVPHTSGYDPKFRSENGEFSPAKAKALLDLYGYVDKDGDGWRDLPDGSPLVIEVATQPDALSRQFDELWAKNMEAVNLRVKFFAGKWPEQLKAARAGKLMLWTLGSSAAGLDGQSALARMYGPEAGSQNLARFKLPAFDAIYQQLSLLPDGPEREALFHEAKRLSVAYMPYKTTVHRFSNDLTQPWVIGYRRGVAWYDWWQYVDIDSSLRRN
ncbi:MAG: bicyclomycin resistance protein [Burkholderiaceae bacterium]|nr:bicyclomycin resistance protein [Burkholderiaceae bacterium]